MKTWYVQGVILSSQKRGWKFWNPRSFWTFLKSGANPSLLSTWGMQPSGGETYFNGYTWSSCFKNGRIFSSGAGPSTFSCLQVHHRSPVGNSAKPKEWNICHKILKSTYTSDLKSVTPGKLKHKASLDGFVGMSTLMQELELNKLALAPRSDVNTRLDWLIKVWTQQEQAVNEVKIPQILWLTSRRRNPKSQQDENVGPGLF